jgi:hypothetical protein
MNCLGENERIQGLELVETVEKESQRRSSHRLAACSSSSIIFLSVTKKKQSFSNVSQVDRLLLGRLPGLYVRMEDE